MSKQVAGVSHRFVAAGAWLMFCATSALAADQFNMLTGVNVGKYPGAPRTVFALPGPGIPFTFNDGDRLAGTGENTNSVVFRGAGTPLYPTNHIGAMSFAFRRATVPAGPTPLPFMGIDFFGGPLLDLDGDNNNGVRSLTPLVGVTPVEIPGSSSHVDLLFDYDGGTVALTNFEATGTNETSTGISAGIAVTLTTLAGTTPTGGLGSGPNPAFDTRSGLLVPHASLPGVYRISNLQVELWYDAIDPNVASANVLGTLQEFARFRGWLVRRNPQTGQFPALTGQLGATLWPTIDTEHVGQTFNTAHNLAGGTAIITDGLSPLDVFSLNPNGIATADLGAYIDSAVATRVAPTSDSFVFLESAGFGINNSNDPVFGDTNGYDFVIVAEHRGASNVPGDLNGDGVVNDTDRLLFVAVLLDPSSQPAAVVARADINADGAANGDDIQPFVALLP